MEILKSYFIDNEFHWFYILFYLLFLNGKLKTIFSNSAVLVSEGNWCVARSILTHSCAMSFSKQPYNVISSLKKYDSIYFFKVKASFILLQNV